MDEIENSGSVVPEEAVVTAPQVLDPVGSAPAQEEAAEPMPWGDHPNPLLWLHEQMQAGFRRMHKTFG